MSAAGCLAIALEELASLVAVGWALWIAGRLLSPLKNEHQEILRRSGAAEQWLKNAVVSSWDVQAVLFSVLRCFVPAESVLGNLEGESGCCPWWFWALVRATTVGAAFRGLRYR